MARLLLLGAIAAFLAACAPPTSSGGEVVEAPEELPAEVRIDQIRSARDVLAEPVADLRGEAVRLAEAVEQVWLLEASSEARGERAEELRLAPFRSAVRALDEVELEGDGPDVVAARGLVAALVDDGETVLAGAEAELATLTAVVPYDAQLEELLAGWDARGSYSQQLAAFAELAAAAEELAATAADRTAQPPCTRLWDRRVTAAETVAARSRDLRVLVRDRRGQDFDELRDEYRQDPYGLGGLLGEMDAAAAAGCWQEASVLPGTVTSIDEGSAALADALDPADLR